MMWGYPWAWPMALWMGIGALFWLAVLGLIAWLVIRLLQNRGAIGRNEPPSELPSEPSAQEILRQRYARGDIDDATYAQMRERLGA